MVTEKGTRTPAGVDKGLVDMFLKMSPEQRLQANDTTAQVIAEMRHACRERHTTKRRLTVLKETLAQLGKD